MVYTRKKKEKICKGEGPSSQPEQDNGPEMKKSKGEGSSKANTGHMQGEDQKEGPEGNLEGIEERGSQVKSPNSGPIREEADDSKDLEDLLNSFY